MKKNIHTADRFIRLMLVVAVAVLYFTHTVSGTSAIIFGTVAIILAITAFTGFCPIYYGLGINKQKKSPQK